MLSTQFIQEQIAYPSLAAAQLAQKELADLEGLKAVALKIQEAHREMPDYCRTWSPCQCGICAFLRKH